MDFGDRVVLTALGHHRQLANGLLVVVEPLEVEEFREVGQVDSFLAEPAVVEHPLEGETLVEYKTAALEGRPVDLLDCILLGRAPLLHALELHEGTIL